MSGQERTAAQGQDDQKWVPTDPLGYALPSYMPDDAIRARIKTLRALPRPLSHEDGLRLGAALEEARRRRLSRV